MFIPLRPTEDAIEIVGKLDEEEFKELLKKCVQSFLVLGQDRTPIKKQDLNRIAFPSIHYKISAAVIQFANKDLNKTFGMRVYELEDKTRYLLVNSRPSFTELTTKFSDDATEELAVLYFVLMEIFVSPDEKVNEDSIEETLKVLELTTESIKSHLEFFVKKLYLTLEKRADVRLYSWGPRSYAEIEPEGFFDQFLSLSGDTSETDWPELRKRIDKLKSTPNR